MFATITATCSSITVSQSSKHPIKCTKYHHHCIPIIENAYIQMQQRYAPCHMSELKWKGHHLTTNPISKSPNHLGNINALFFYIYSQNGRASMQSHLQPQIYWVWSAFYAMVCVWKCKVYMCVNINKSSRSVSGIRGLLYTIYIHSIDWYCACLFT